MKVIGLLLALAAVAAGAWLVFDRGDEAPQGASFRTEPVTRRDLVATIDATGTVEPEEVVDVGAQVAGKIVAFGTDKEGTPIDYGSTVEEDTVLARIDDSLYAADLAQANAQLESAHAAVTRAQADVTQMQAKLAQAEADWNRAQRLEPSDVLPQSTLDASKAAFETAQANVAVAEAAVEQAKAGVALADAGVQRAQRNLGYCVIRSPVQGVIIDRRVNIGQTVVSSLNAPSLFLIAKDLHRVQVWVAVNEAEISGVHPGQPVTFTVDALPGKVFHGEVLKVRLNASMTQNVVTYTVEVAADNHEGLLLPYLTANVSFVVAQRDAVLTVPAAALTYTPAEDHIDPRFLPLAEPAAGEARLFTPTGKGLLRPIAVTAGLQAGRDTEVSGKDVQEGLPVVVGESAPTAAGTAAGGTNPFTPNITRGRRNVSR